MALKFVASQSWIGAFCPAPIIAAQCAIAGQNAMAGNEKADRIAAHCRADCTKRLRLINGASDGGIARHLPRRNVQQSAKRRVESACLSAPILTASLLCQGRKSERRQMMRVVFAYDIGLRIILLQTGQRIPTAFKQSMRHTVRGSRQHHIAQWCWVTVIMQAKLRPPLRTMQAGMASMEIKLAGISFLLFIEID